MAGQWRFPALLLVLLAMWVCGAENPAAEDKRSRRSRSPGARGVTLLGLGSEVGVKMPHKMILIKLHNIQAERGLRGLTYVPDFIDGQVEVQV